MCCVKEYKEIKRKLLWKNSTASEYLTKILTINVLMTVEKRLLPNNFFLHYLHVPLFQVPLSYKHIHNVILVACLIATL